ncbi:MAG: protein kinase, partial [Acidobacteria bacterium]|nr:protein kinase [Acidobacteriota bacterium]
GTRLGPYEILEPLGAGGMGEVYRARDTTLRRDVALKILPDDVSSDEARLARFEREARLLAAVNHPAIATLHGLEESSGRRFLVMECVEGETLAARIVRHRIPVSEALGLAMQVAEGLEAAHEKGIVHRDLKPANIMVLPSGHIKILDFGLAKVAPESVSSEAPTISRQATQVGAVLGTTAYMSPEQARGQDVDARTDIWALGCVLYEALTGRPAFKGETVSDTITRILSHEPQWNALPPGTPRRARELLQLCLEKRPEKRLHHVADARIEMERMLEAPEEAPAAERAPSWRLGLGLGAVGVALGVGLAGLLPVENQRESERAPVRLSLSLPDSERLAGLDFDALAISPDGSQLAYVAHSEGAERLHLRSMDTAHSVPITGSEGARNPFFSPDGRWLAFFAGGQLKKVQVPGGAPVALAEVPSPRGASWGPGDMIVFAPIPLSGLSRIGAEGGKPEPLTTLESESGGTVVSHRWPDLLPGGRAVVYVQFTGDTQEVVAQDLSTGERHLLAERGRHPRYVPSGHLVFARGPTLFAASFDLETLELTGPPIPVVEGVMGSWYGASQFTFSRDGTLYYVSSSSGPVATQLTVVDRSGRVVRVLGGAPQSPASPRLSPDGKRVAMDDFNVVWTYDLESGARTRLTFGARAVRPVWTRDGERIVFVSMSEGLSAKRADGSGEAARLWPEGRRRGFPTATHPSGRLLALTVLEATTGLDIWMLPLDGEGEPRPFLASRANEFDATFSPDGRWVAYVSDETGRNEVYVQPLAHSDGKWQISGDGGSEPVWSRGGRELLYRNGDRFMVVDTDTEADFKSGKPRMLFEGRYATNVTGTRNYDITPDGENLLLVALSEDGGEEAAPRRIHVVLNWFEELKRLAPTE